MHSKVVRVRPKTGDITWCMSREMKEQVFTLKKGSNERVRNRRQIHDAQIISTECDGTSVENMDQCE